MSSTRLFTRNKHQENAQVVCRYRTEVEANLVNLIFECKGCPGGGDLSDKKCMSETLTAISAEFNVDIIIFSDYIETKYSGAAIEMLKQASKILDETQRFALRKPWEEFVFANSSGLTVQKKACAQCSNSPYMIFSHMKREGERSLEGLYKLYNSYISSISQFEPHNCCQKCIETTKGDLLYIQELLLELRAFVLQHAFKIVEDEP